jgi:predicted methyltransferase
MRGILFGGAMTLLVSLPAVAMEPALQRAVDAPTRSAKFIARDGARHPAVELAFFGVTPRSTVVEIWPGGGYWTQILAPLLHDQGTYYAATGSPDGGQADAFFKLSPAFRQMLDASPAVYGRVRLTVFGAHHPGLAPPGSADVVLTFRNLHNWMAGGDAAEKLAAIRLALKPGGILGIEDHRGSTKTPQDPKAANGYVRQDYATALIERAGFTLVGSSEMNANPRDTAEWPQGVWTLPPTLALGKQDRAKYLAIGEADNFTLKFRKSGS